MSDDLERIIQNDYLHVESNSSIAYYAVYSVDGERLLGYTETPGTIEYNTHGIWIAPYPPSATSNKSFTIVTLEKKS